MMTSQERNEWYFSGFNSMNQDILDILNIDINDYYNDNNNTFLDLDWCFILFLLLGVIPIKETQYITWYIDNKILNAIPNDIIWTELQV